MEQLSVLLGSNNFESMDLKRHVVALICIVHETLSDTKRLHGALLYWLCEAVKLQFL